MVDFKTYYKNKFQQDLLKFLSNIPNKSKYHYNNTEITIQYFTLTPKYNFLDTIDTNNHGLFSLSLYWTILVDQITYTLFKKDYIYFHRLTLYPKFIGNCTGTGFFNSDCGHHQDPSKILITINDYMDNGNRFDFNRKPYEKYKSINNRHRIDFSHILIGSEAVIKSEIMDYFVNHQPLINCIDIWNKCEYEMKKINFHVQYDF